MDVLLERPPWFLTGPLLGLVVVAVFLSFNDRLGVVGGLTELVERVGGGRRALGWKAWFVLGIVAGGLAFALGTGDLRTGDGYGWLQRALGSPLATGAVLVSGGVLIGLGARTAGGCTSGNGLGGCSFASPASFAATGTFMATAVAAAFSWRWLLA